MHSAAVTGSTKYTADWNEELEALNQSMRDRDKMKDDAIAHLSDQLIALTVRLDSIEKRQ